MGWRRQKLRTRVGPATVVSAAIAAIAPVRREILSDLPVTGSLAVASWMRVPYVGETHLEVCEVVEITDKGLWKTNTCSAKVIWTESAAERTNYEFRVRRDDRNEPRTETGRAGRAGGTRNQCLLKYINFFFIGYVDIHGKPFVFFFRGPSVLITEPDVIIFLASSTMLPAEQRTAECLCQYSTQFRTYSLLNTDR